MTKIIYLLTNFHIVNLFQTTKYQPLDIRFKLFILRMHMIMMLLEYHLLRTSSVLPLNSKYMYV